jgi:hypothetical protein
MKDKIYCRQLEDKSGYGVFLGGPPGPALRWEEVLGLGSTEKQAWKSYETGMYRSLS